MTDYLNDERCQLLENTFQVLQRPMAKLTEDQKLTAYARLTVLFMDWASRKLDKPLAIIAFEIVDEVLDGTEV